jgi:hypothetical protein
VYTIIPFSASKLATVGRVKIWGAMGRINRTEVEELARALARHHGRRWNTMPAINGGREAWLNRAHTVLQAVDKAMTLEIQRGIAAPRN